MLLKLKVLDQNVCIFLSLSSIQIKVFSLLYYRLLQLCISLVQESLFLPEKYCLRFLKNI